MTPPWWSRFSTRATVRCGAGFDLVSHLSHGRISQIRLTTGFVLASIVPIRFSPQN
jgi:hypothetical protein